MSNFTIGEDAFNAPTDAGSANDVEWSKLNSGMSYNVRLFPNYTEAVMKFRNYGIYKKVNSFSAKNPSIKDARGFAEKNLTPWDKASQYYAELLFKAMDAKDAVKEKEYKQLAGLYREKERYAVAFIDIDTGLPVHFDVSPRQWGSIREVITKYKDNLSSLPFTLSKSGSGTATVVSLMPIMTQFSPLTDKQQANFDKGGEMKFDPEVFKGFIYEVDDDEQVQLLVQAGFDISLIGLEAPSKEEESKDEGDTNKPFANDGEPIDISDEDLPF